MKTDTTAKATNADTMGKRYPVVVTQSAESRIMREVYEDCDLHKALMNVGYDIYRKDYYIKGKYTGKVVDYYAPAIDYSSQRYTSATLSQLYELDARLGTDFVGDLKRDLKGFGGDPLYDYFYGR